MCVVVQGEFFNCPVPKRPTSQPEALLDEGFHGRAALVGSIAFLDALASLDFKLSVSE